MTCIIVDDEPLAQEVLESYISKLSFLTLLKKCSNAYEAINFLHQQEVDVLFIDIQMPEINGLKFLRTLSHRPATIFTTAFRQYAYEGFELGVVDFLLKPISFERFVKSIDRINERFQTRPAPQQADGDERKFLFIYSGKKKIKLDLTAIEYVKALKDYTIIETSEEKHIVKKTMKEFESILPSDQFLRVHKSYIIPVSRIKSVHGNSIQLAGETIPIGRFYKGVVKKVTG